MSEARRVADELEQAIERTIRALGINITAELIETTPVDTGWARANWVPNAGSPFTGNSELLDAEAQRAAVPGQVASQTAASSSLIRYKLSDGDIFISNNVPYIVRLNEGSSMKAPSGFVQQSIARTIVRLTGRIPRRS